MQDDHTTVFPEVFIRRAVAVVANATHANRRMNPDKMRLVSTKEGIQAQYSEAHTPLVLDPSVVDPATSATKERILSALAFIKRERKKQKEKRFEDMTHEELVAKCYHQREEIKRLHHCYETAVHSASDLYGQVRGIRKAVRSAIG